MAQGRTAGENAPRVRGAASALARVLKFTAARAVALMATVAAGVFLTIVIANLGGHVDEIRRSEIRSNLMNTFTRFDENPGLRSLTPQERSALLEEMAAAEERRLGLDRPFLERAFRWLGDALLLDLGRAQHLTSDSGSRQVRAIILERLGPTLLLFATAEIFVFAAYPAGTAAFSTGSWSLWRRPRRRRHGSTASFSS